MPLQLIKIALFTFLGVSRVKPFKISILVKHMGKQIPRTFFLHQYVFCKNIMCMWVSCSTPSLMNSYTNSFPKDLSFLFFSFICISGYVFTFYTHHVSYFLSTLFKKYLMRVFALEYKVKLTQSFKKIF